MLLAALGTILSLAAALTAAQWLLGRLRWHWLCWRYELDPALGFLPAGCAGMLPPELRLWDELAVELPALNRAGRLRTAVDELAESLPGAVAASIVDQLRLPELRRTYVLLSAVSHSLLNGDAAVWRGTAGGSTVDVSGTIDVAGGQRTSRTPGTRPVLPSQLALPWRAACRRLGLPEVLTSTGLDLWNHPAAPRGCQLSASSFRPLISMSGTEAERGFHAVPLGVQLALAPLLPQLLDAPTLIRRRNWPGGAAALTRLCGQLAHALRHVLDVLRSIETLVDPDEFFYVYRPLLAGWDEDGLELQGVPADEGRGGEAGAGSGSGWEGGGEGGGSGGGGSSGEASGGGGGSGGEASGGVGGSGGEASGGVGGSGGEASGGVGGSGGEASGGVGGSGGEASGGVGGSGGEASGGVGGSGGEASGGVGGSGGEASGGVGGSGVEASGGVGGSGGEASGGVGGSGGEASGGVGGSGGEASGGVGGSGGEASGGVGGSGGEASGGVGGSGGEASGGVGGSGGEASGGGGGSGWGASTGVCQGGGEGTGGGSGTGSASSSVIVGNGRSHSDANGGSSENRTGVRPQWLVVRHKGPSAGQTAILMLVDAVLGVSHGPLGSNFRHGMRTRYLPTPHAALLTLAEAQLRASGSLRHAAAEPDACPLLVAAHAAAVDALAAMRAHHLKIASRYLRRTSVGTGGSDFRALLGENLAATRRAKVETRAGRPRQE